MRPQHDGARFAQIDKERVPHAARRVRRRHVERGEVVPVGLDLWPLAHGEAKTDEDVLEPFMGLRHEMKVAATRAGEALGEIEAFVLEPMAALTRGQLADARAQGPLDLGHRRVQRLARILALGRPEPAETLLQLAERRPPTREFRLDRSCIGDGRDLARTRPRRRVGRPQSRRAWLGTVDGATSGNDLIASGGPPRSTAAWRPSRH